MNPEDSSENPPSPGTNWPGAVMWICIVGIMAASAVYVFKSCVEAPGRLAGGVADRMSKVAHDLASSFVQGTVTTQFKEYCTEVRPNLALQVATLKQIEEFTRTDEATVGNIPLPEVVVRVTAPVEYTYQLNLSGAWDFKRQGDLITVICPDPKPNPPSFDVSHMEWEVKKDSIFRRTSQVMEGFKESLMPLAVSRGKARLGLVRETARGQVVIFVQNWVNQRFADGQKYQIKVVFESEARRNGV